MYIYIYIDPSYNILYQYMSSPGMLPKVIMWIDLYFFLFSKYYLLSNLFLFQGIKYLLLTWSSFVWCHVMSSVPSQVLMIKTLCHPFRYALSEWIQRFREMLWMCEDGLCVHWYVLRLIATNIWCKLGHQPMQLSGRELIIRGQVWTHIWLFGEPAFLDHFYI